MFPRAVYHAAEIIYLCSVHAEQIGGAWCALSTAVHTYDGITCGAPAEFLPRCDGVLKNFVGSFHAGDQLGVTAVHIAVALAGHLNVCCHGQNGHAGSVFRDEAC